MTKSIIFMNRSAKAMQLNPVGLVGFFILLNLIQLVGFDFFSGCCFIVLNGNARGDSGPRLLRKNPLITFTDRQFKKDFRFAKADIPRLLAVFQWPLFMYTVNQVQYTAEICLLMVLYRFAYPSTLNKLEVTFEIHASACCGIVNVWACGRKKA